MFDRMGPLEKWGRRCAYCGARNVPLEIEYIHPKVPGGSDRVSNLTVAYHPGNQWQALTEFLAGGPNRVGALSLPSQTLGGAATVHSGRRALFRHFKATGMDVKIASEYRTQFNRHQWQVPKAQQIPVCAAIPEALRTATRVPNRRHRQKNVVVGKIGSSVSLAASRSESQKVWSQGYPIAATRSLSERMATGVRSQK